MIELSGKIALITGGSRGIGAACAEMLARAGADIVITYTKNKKAASEVQKRAEQFGVRCLVLKCDVASSSQVRNAVRNALKTFSRIDVLVNNAGIWTYGAIGEMTERQWDETMDINMKGTFLFTNAVVPIMKKQKGGKVINIASTAGQRGETFHSHYAASKGAMIAFTKSIGPELAPHNIIANCVAPGWVDTDMSADTLRDPAQADGVNKIIPRGRPATAEEIAGAVLFLSSEFSNHMVGSTISVNGGAVLSN
jgi:3-oxoacyl-[acyl-carrier protein] reductase